MLEIYDRVVCGMWRTISIIFSARMNKTYVYGSKSVNDTLSRWPAAQLCDPYYHKLKSVSGPIYMQKKIKSYLIYALFFFATKSCVCSGGSSSGDIS
jgi:hypothetical protein